MCTSTCARPAAIAPFILSLGAVLTLLPANPASAERDRPGRPQKWIPPAEPAPDLSRYAILTVSDLGTSEALDTEREAQAMADLADRFAAAVSESDVLALEVRRGAPLGRADELVLGGTVQTARPGRRITRYLVGPFGRARLVVDLNLSNGATGEVESEGTIKKIWAFPGWLGASRGFKNLMDGACIQVVDYLEGLQENAPAVAPVPVGSTSPTKIARVR